MLYLFLLCVHSLDGQTMASSTYRQPNRSSAALGRSYFGGFKNGHYYRRYADVGLHGRAGGRCGDSGQRHDGHDGNDALCIITGVEMETAIAIAVPVSVMGQLGRMAAWTINTPLMHIADKYAETADYKKMTRLQLVGSLVFFITEFIPVFLCIYFGSSFVTMVNENMPVWISEWLTAATGMLPALGFGMLLAMMYKVKYIPFFIVGFVMCAVFGGSLLAIALLGVSMAIFVFFFGPQGKRRKGGAI